MSLSSDDKPLLLIIVTINDCGRDTFIFCLIKSIENCHYTFTTAKWPVGNPIVDCCQRIDSFFFSKSKLLQLCQPPYKRHQHSEGQLSHFSVSNACTGIKPGSRRIVIKLHFATYSQSYHLDSFIYNLLQLYSNDHDDSFIL
ncbi:hypothetical protein BLOT_015460 [Blomia tropicalis]|nr:hypothetical protein BLOT_015460 [Blomia tropicalis]